MKLFVWSSEKETYTTRHTDQSIVSIRWALRDCLNNFKDGDSLMDNGKADHFFGPMPLSEVLSLALVICVCWKFFRVEYLVLC